MIVVVTKHKENYFNGFLLEGGFMCPAQVYTRLVGSFTRFKKLLRDAVGALILRDWKSIEKENIVLVDETMLPEVFRIQAESFDSKNHTKLLKYSKKLRKIFYVIKNQDKIAGYCTYYLIPEISFQGLKKKSMVYSIAIDSKFRGMGYGRKLLEESIKEMKLNGISSVFLYVNVVNTPAIRLYKNMNFKVIEEIEGVCGQQENCYIMELKLT